MFPQCRSMLSSAAHIPRLRFIKKITAVNCFNYSTAAKIEEISPNSVRIYEAPLVNRLKHVKLFSFLSSALGIPMQPIIIQKIAENPEKTWLLGSFFIFISSFTYGSPILIHLVAQKYVLWLDYNPSKDDYTLYTYSFFLKHLPFTFKANEVSVPPTLSALSTVKIKNRSFFLDSDCFSDLEHYKRMMRYDRAIDLKLEEPTIPTMDLKPNPQSLQRPNTYGDETQALNLKKSKKKTKST